MTSAQPPRRDVTPFVTGELQVRDRDEADLKWLAAHWGSYF
jgi:hypothetical protein